jgi:hypothetical protein
MKVKKARDSSAIHWASLIISVNGIIRFPLILKGAKIANLKEYQLSLKNY